jgi:hypothetical protein
MAGCVYNSRCEHPSQAGEVERTGVFVLRMTTCPSLIMTMRTACLGVEVVPRRLLLLGCFAMSASAVCLPSMDKRTQRRAECQLPNRQAAATRRPGLLPQCL